MKERREEGRLEGGKEGKEGTREGKKVCCFARYGSREETFSVVSDGSFCVLRTQRGRFLRIVDNGEDNGDGRPWENRLAGRRE